jgi:PKD repeat protein
MKKHTGFKPFGWSLLLAVALAGPAFPQARNCDFWGTAKYRGVDVTGSDQVKAYDAGGQLCGTAYSVGSGIYGIHVVGDDPSTPGVDEGAPEGGAITFKINNETANVTGGSNVWTLNGSVECNIAVPDLPPNANHGGPYTGNEGSSIQFNGSGSTGAATYAWEFGDGGTSTSMNPTHTYTDNGTYTVRLTVTNNSSQSDSKTTTATVSNVAPTVSASSNAPKNEGESVQFTGSATDPAGVADPLGYSWNFGDGGSSAQQNPTHTYADNGTYNVTLTVSDGDGGTGSKQIQAVINNVAPTASASSNAPKNEGAAVQFTGSATDPAGVADPLGYSWNFGDGGSSAQQNPTHTYADNGTYNVTLTVSDGDGGTDSKQIQAVINNVAPTANAGGPYYGVINYSLQFNGSATDPGSADVLTFTWDLDNDGLYDDFTGPNPAKTYTAIGNYTVALRVADDDGGVDTKTASVEVGIGIPVTFKTQPSGLQLKIDGVTITTPNTFYYVNGSTHSVEAAYVQNEVPGSRQAFTNWSDGQQLAHSISVGTQPAEYTANYKLQYFLDIDDGGKGAHIQGESYYDPGSQVNISVDASVTDPAGTTRYLFERWQGTGPGAYSGTQINAVVTVNGPITERVVWGTGEYYLRVESSFGTVHGSGWYTPGASAEVSVDTSVSSGPGRRQKFLSWRGQGTGSYTGPSNPATVRVDAPVVETAEWRVEYFLDILNSYGNPSGEGWYLAGSTALIRADSAVLVQPGKRMHFSGWAGTGEGSYTGPLILVSVPMNGPVVEAVVWRTQYLLSLVSLYDTPRGTGWYDDGTRVSFSIDTLVQQNSTVRYRFKGWEGFGTGSYTGLGAAAEAIMTSPVLEEARWDQEYRVAVTVDPPETGTVSPFGPGGGWGTASDTLELRAIGRTDLGYGFSHWTGDASGAANPLFMVLNGSKILTAHFKQGSVFINTQPSGLLVRIDGNSLVSPVVFDWAAGEHHRIGADSLQGDDASVRYAFTGWSDGNPREHQITVTGTSQKITAAFDEYVYLNLESEFGTPAGEGWYKKGSTATVSVDSAAQVTADTRRRFKGWIGTGPGAVTTPAQAFQCLVQGPIVERAAWEAQCRVEAIVFPPGVPGASIDKTPSLAWYALGAAVTFRAVAQDPDHPFLSWSGAVTGTANPVQALVSKPLKVTGRFRVPDDPPSISNLPNFVLREDEPQRVTFDWLRQYVSDPNDPIEMLDFAFEGAPDISFVPDFEKQELLVTPAPHWNGTESVTVTVADPYGLTASDTVEVKVLSIEDPPGRFRLLYPAAGTELTDWKTPLLFIWYKASDPDPGDAVQYSFVLSDAQDLKGPRTMKMSSVPDTTLLVSAQDPGTYFWGVLAKDGTGNTMLCESVFRLDIVTGIRNPAAAIPQRYTLEQNYPNPFNPSTAIPFGLPKPGQVQIRVFDIHGRMVRALEDRRFEAGFHEVRWDGTDGNGSQAGSGVYLVRIQSGNFVKQRKMILLR